MNSQHAAAKVASKKKMRKKAVRKPAAKKPKAKAASRSTLRKELQALTDRLLAHVADYPHTEAAKVLGVAIYDVANMRNGYGLSIPVLIKMTRVGKFLPSSVINGPKLRKLPKGYSVRGMTHTAISRRIHKLAAERPARDWAKATGLSHNSIYQMRGSNARNIGVYALLGFMRAGQNLNTLLFGR